MDRVACRCHLLAVVASVLRVVGILAVAASGVLMCSGGTLAAKSLVDPQVSSQLVVVPRVTGDVLGAYKRLRSAGLRVSIPQGLSFDAPRPPFVAGTSPAPGSRVARDSVVRMFVSCCRRVRGLRVTARRMLRLTAPDFAGAVASTAYSWAHAHGLDFKAHVGPLRAGTESGL